MGLSVQSESIYGLGGILISAQGQGYLAILTAWVITVGIVGIFTLAPGTLGS
jgi:hypothetical protein